MVFFGVVEGAEVTGFFLQKACPCADVQYNKLAGSVVAGGIIGVICPKRE